MMDKPRYYTGMPRALWWAAAAVVAVGMVGLGIYTGIDRIRTNERTRVLASAQRTDSVMWSLRERQVSRTIDSLKAEGLRIDTVLLRRIDTVRYVVSAVPESVFVQNPEVANLIREYQALAVDCETCRQVAAALRDSVAVRDSLMRERTLRSALLLDAATAAQRRAEVEASRKVSRFSCTTAAVTVGLGGYLIGAITK